MTKRPQDKARFEYEINGPVVDVYDGSALLDEELADNRHRMTKPLARVNFEGDLERSLRLAVSSVYRHTAQKGPLHIEFYTRSNDGKTADYELDWSADPE